MKQKSITWLVNDLEIPAIGVTQIGKSVMINSIIADSYIQQGIATDGRVSKKEKEIIEKGGKNK